jgi:hypothetical protein
LRHSQDHANPAIKRIWLVEKLLLARTAAHL